VALTVALVHGARLDATTMAVADGAVAAYGSSTRLTDGVSLVVWIIDGEADQGVAADLRSVFNGSGATVDVTSFGADTITPAALPVPPPGG
jgi:hypothetical protein